MEMNFRDLLVIVGVLVVLGVLADGLRRMWLAKRRANELNFGLEEIQGCEDDFGSELPNGGARLLDDEEEEVRVSAESRVRKEPIIAAPPNDNVPGDTLPNDMVSTPRVMATAPEQMQKAGDASDHRPTSAVSKPEPVQTVACDKTQDVAPVESDQGQSVFQAEPVVPTEPSFSFGEKPEPVVSRKFEPVVNIPPAQKPAPALKQKTIHPAEVKAEPAVFAGDIHLSIKPEAEDIKVRSEVASAKEPAPRRKRFFERSHFHRHKEQQNKKIKADVIPEPIEELEPAPVHHEPVEEVLIMNLVAPKGMPFPGGQVLASFQRVGLRFGDMNIFHRHVQEDGTGETLFSVANGVEPGTFDLKSMDESFTPAVSFFLGLPGPHDPLQAFRIMVEAIHHIAHDLQGTLRDDQHSVLTQQTLEHYRQRICDFERHQLTRRNKSTAGV